MDVLITLINHIIIKENDLLFKLYLLIIIKIYWNTFKYIRIYKKYKIEGGIQFFYICNFGPWILTQFRNNRWK